MNKNLKPALLQGMIIFLGCVVLGPLLMEPENTKYLTFLLFGLFFGSIRAIVIYRYKKNTIEDERLISVRQKALSIWFIIMLGAIAIIPELAIIYAVNINNPMIMLGSTSVALEELAWVIMIFNAYIGFFCLLGSYITEKILMKSHEK